MKTATGRSFVTELHTGADVRSITEDLIAHAATAGGTLTSAELGRTLETAGVSPVQAKKLLRTLTDAGVTVVVDGSATSRRRVSAARSATAASRATTVRTGVDDGVVATEEPPAPPQKKATKAAAPKAAKKAALKALP